MTKLAALVLLSWLCSCVSSPSGPGKVDHIAKISQAPSFALEHHGPIKIHLDQYGVPYINAKSIPDVMYGLGRMHAKDRLFQLDTMRLMALGRLSELLGKATLEMDYRFRRLIYKLDEQVERLDADEKELLTAYVQGVNDGAKAYGPSSEHTLLNRGFSTFTLHHAVAIARLQIWYLAADMSKELAKQKLLRSGMSTPVKQMILGPVNDRDHAILNNKAAADLESWPALPAHNPKLKSRSDLEIDFAPLGSNSWAVAKNLTADGHAILLNDPHLRHTWPSNFYMAALFVDDQLLAAGGTFPGIAAVLIGGTPNLAYGVTASYLNTVDLVTLPLSGLNYEVEGHPYELMPWPQKFCIDLKNCEEKTFYLSHLGPVVDETFDPLIEKGESYALMWTGFEVEKHHQFTKYFVDLTKAPTVLAATQVIAQMTMPGINVVLADTAGEIGYAYAGLIPKRDETQHPFLPLDGRKKSSAWAAFVPPAQKPHQINPSRGYVVAANQNIFSKDAGVKHAFGQSGADPSRAVAIETHIKAALTRGEKLSKENMARWQTDSVSLQAQSIALALGKICESHFANRDEKRQEFAKIIANFNGDFSTDSVGAIPYLTLMEKLLQAKAQMLTKTKISLGIMHQSSLGSALRLALMDYLHRHQARFFVDSDIISACDEGYIATTQKYGHDPRKWRYGRHHYLQRQSPLSRIPVLGRMFQDKKREVAGTGDAIMAEVGLPVIYGANLRFIAHMSTPPTLEMILDSGNSGQVSTKHAFDQAELWHRGETIRFVTNWADIVSRFASLEH
jgi:penicillin amidase